MKRVFYCAMAAAISMSITSPAFADDDTGFFLGASVNRLSADQKDVNDVDFGLF